MSQIRRRSLEKNVCVNALLDLPSSRKLDDNKDDPVLTKKEFWGWCLFDGASSAFSSGAMACFLTLFLEKIGYETAGFPYSCPNMIGDANIVHKYFEFENTMFV
ncbi:hypothetical protein WA158_002665 [Blastocystis sp. Blastoise]